MKLCFNCMRKIPTLAGKCPYCTSDDQEPYGRIIFTVIGIAVFVWLVINFL
jgi:RNA polymerase subunit RPABC4/transcription elongation factor Spt4